MWKAGFLLRCPACEKGRLYSGILKVADACSVCGFPLKKHEAADGPAYIAMVITGALTVILAFITEFSFQPPLWAHALLWIPFVFCGSVLCLIYAKALMIAWQYKHRVGAFTKEG